MRCSQVVEPSDSPSHERTIATCWQSRTRRRTSAQALHLASPPHTRSECTATKTDGHGLNLDDCQPAQPAHAVCQLRNFLISARLFVFPASASCRHTHHPHATLYAQNAGCECQVPHTRCSLQGLGRAEMRHREFASSNGIFKMAVDGPKQRESQATIVAPPLTCKTKVHCQALAPSERCSRDAALPRRQLLGLRGARHEAT